MKKQKKKKWTRPRHCFVRNLAFVLLYPYIRLRYRIRITRFRGDAKPPYLVLLNHQTPFDQFFLGISFKGPIYYMATEDIFSNGWISSAIRYLIAPIPIKKQTTDVRAVINCLQVVREGGTIAIAPEGNRTYSGRTEYMSPSIVPLARKLNCPILLYRIEGGYGKEPRWSDVVRRGKMRSYVSRVLTPEEYAAMTDEELFEIIKTELYVNEAVADAAFHHRKAAEYLERAVYVCPYCGLSSFESHKEHVTCLNCKRSVRYLPTKELVGEGFDFPFRFVADWYDYQKDFICKLDLAPYHEKPLYRDTVELREVIPYEKKKLLSKAAAVSLYGDRIAIESDWQNLVVPFAEAHAVTVLGRNKIDLYYDGKIYQFKGSKRFNALKYVHIFHRYQNIQKGVEHEQFLGL